MDILIAIFVLLLFLDFLLSAAEIALAAFGENRIEELKENEDKYVQYFEKLNTNQEEVYSSIHLAITFLNVIISITGYFLFSKWFSQYFNQWFAGSAKISITITVLITTIFVTSIVLIFVVLVPKAIAYRYSDFIAKKSIKIILFFSSGLKYITSAITFLSNIILLPFKEKINFSQERPSEDEILDIISDGVKSGTIDEADKEIIENIFEFNDLKANEVMIPRTDMAAINLLDESEKNIESIIKTGHTLLPVYENSLDNIVGVLHTKDVMKTYIEGQKFLLRNLIRPSYFVPETKLISEILKDMQKQGERLAIVTDEYGGTEGVITMEDILEEIVGEIKDNTTTQIHSYSKLPDGKYYVLGSMNVTEFNEIFNHKLPESEDYNTIAGFIAEKTGKIMNPGENFEYENLTFELIKKIRQKMVQFRIFSSNQNLEELKGNS
jgi:putative hemolysin